MNAGDHEQHIRQSWAVNAAVWAEVVRAQGIASRREITNQAIIEAVLRVTPRRLLDIGCGEGWLMRHLSAEGVDCVGIDAEPALIAAAQRLGGGQFVVCDYLNLPEWAAQRAPQGFDAAVCNFSLIGEASTESVFAAASRRALAPGGYLIVQTLHPCAVVGDGCGYVSGWREGSWAGFDARFTDPAPWYFRTLADWLAVFQRHGFALVTLQEPQAASAPRPASLILVGRLG